MKGDDIEDRGATGLDKLASTLAKNALERAEKPKRAKRKPPSGQPQWAFSFLGYNHSFYYYLSHGSRQVITLSSAAHTKNNLYQLDTLLKWKAYFQTDEGKFNVDGASDWLINESHRHGIYDPTRQRGRGAWWDDGRCVLHCGDELVIDGTTKPLYEFVDDSKFIYEASVPLGVKMAQPLTANEANQFQKLCEGLLWERPIAARYLAGWIVCALIGGALRWRPHLWITGESGSGKSWVMDHVVAPVLEGFKVYVSSVTTEAGLRHRLVTDALPVIFTDVDTDDQAGVQRMQNVLGLMRLASDNSGAKIVKGSANGTAIEYDIRSCFCCGSIHIPIVKTQDQNRISVVSLLRKKTNDPTRASEFKKLQAAQVETLTPDYIRRFQARAISMIPIIRKNAETLASAAASAIGTQRLGDQYGALLAGSYSLDSDELITPTAAKEWIDNLDWSEAQELAGDQDQLRCLEHISQCIIRTDAGERSVEELVGACTGVYPDFKLTGGQAYDALRRHGLKLSKDNKTVAISNSNSSLAKLMHGSVWNRNWGTVLERVEGAIKQKPRRGAEGKNERAVILPAEMLISD